MTREELNNVYGGVSWGMWAGLGSAITFILGFLEGLVNPVLCGK